MTTQAAAPPESSADDPSPRQRKAMRAAILAQCFGVPSELFLIYGFVLLYFKALGVTGGLLLAMLSLVRAMGWLKIFAAWWGDRWGKKRIGVLGQWFMTVSFALMILGPYAPAAVRVHLLVLSILCFSTGEALFGSVWFALLSPVVPIGLRARFFGLLRFSWQSFGLVFLAVCTLCLGHDTSIGTFQWALLAALIGMLVRFVYYARIPEMESTRSADATFRSSFMSVMRLGDYVSFCCYLFLLSVATTSSPFFFGLIEKEVLGLGDHQVAGLGLLLMAGAIPGFLLGARWVDRRGTRPVFLICHATFAILLLLFVFRPAHGDSLQLLYLVVAHVLYGGATATLSIAVSTELLALLPRENKSLAASLYGMLYWSGGSLTGLLGAWFISRGALAAEWRLGAWEMSHYDSILLVCAAMVLVLVVTLGLVPSVVHKADWTPLARST